MRTKSAFLIVAVLICFSARGEELPTSPGTTSVTALRPQLEEWRGKLRDYREGKVDRQAWRADIRDPDGTTVIPMEKAVVSWHLQVLEDFAASNSDDWDTAYIALYNVRRMHPKSQRACDMAMALLRKELPGKLAGPLHGQAIWAAMLLLFDQDTPEAFDFVVQCERPEFWERQVRRGAVWDDTTSYYSDDPHEATLLRLRAIAAGTLAQSAKPEMAVEALTRIAAGADANTPYGAHMRKLLKKAQDCKEGKTEEPAIP